ncbi:hypothetical protein TYRP_015609 [Tyrophagus putrescentiae]|nr:hypothetical protein TYRP_015609 [Tyrophagus putrescentiae]
MSASNFEPPPPNLVHRPSTFTAKFRRRRKEEASISTFTLFTLFIFVITTTTLITSSHCLPFISSSQDDHHGTGAGGSGGDCEMVSCFGGGEQPNLISMSCPALKALHQCLKTLKCNGNLQYHTFQWMVRNSKRRCRSGGSGNGNGGNQGRGDHPKADHQSHHSPPHHHHHSSRSNRKQSRTSPSSSPSPSSSSSTPSLLRSGDASFASFQQQLITNGKGQSRHSPHPLSVLSPVPATSQHSQTYSSSSSSSSSSLSSPSSSTSSSISPPWKTVSEQYCLSAAYNFTIGEPVLDSAHFAAVASRSSAVAVANPEEHQQQSLLLLQQQVIRGAHLRMAAKEEKEEESSSLGKKRQRLQRRDTSHNSGSSRGESARIDAEMRKRLGDAFKDYFRGQSQQQQQQQQQHSNSQSKPSSSSSSESFIQDHNLLQQSTAAARAYRDISGSSGSNIQQQQPISPPLSGSSLSELHYKPVAPMTPSLTCMIFGDPHLRTFDSRYQTCSLLGARSLIEHPLFDVQITNTRLQDQFNATGVTKVIVQVRNFAPCAIATDLLYETDSLTQDLPSSTFTDGSREHPTSAGLIRISTSSESLGLVVTIHLDHLGVRIYVSQFTHTKFINVVIKFRTATSAAVKQKLVLEAISPISLCKAGCGQRELVDVEGTLKAAGIETKGSGGKGAKGPVPQRVDGDADGYDEEDSGDKSVNEDEDEDEEEEEEVFTGKVTGTVAEDEEAEEDDEDDDEYYDDPSSSKDEASDYSEQLMPQKGPRAKRVKKETGVAEAAESGGQRKTNKNRRREGRRNRNKNQKKAKADDSKRYLESSPSALLPPVPLHLLHLQPPPPPPPPQLSSVISSSEAQSLSPSSGELPPPPFPNSNSKPYQSKPPSLTEECHEMMPFYRLACLYDTVLKGIVSNYPHKFALSFDEPRLPAEFYPSAGTGSGSSSGADGSSATSRSSSPSAVGGSGSGTSSAVPVTGAGVVITPILLGVITTLLLTQL